METNEITEGISDVEITSGDAYPTVEMDPCVELIGVSRIRGAALGPITHDLHILDDEVASLHDAPLGTGIIRIVARGLLEGRSIAVNYQVVAAIDQDFVGLGVAGIRWERDNRGRGRCAIWTRRDSGLDSRLTVRRVNGTNISRRRRRSIIRTSTPRLVTRFISVI
jgi:hypothetical protein